MGRFDGVLLCTDLDGTLFRADGTVSAENKEAIEYFMREGGYYTFVTGRMPFYVSDAYEAVRPNAPFGCVNGGGLYDLETNRYVWTAPMGEGVNELIATVDRAFPQMGIQVNTFYKTYFCKDNETMQAFRRSTRLPNIMAHYNDVQGPLAKIIFGSEQESELQAAERLLLSHSRANDFDFVRSEPTLLEILPKNIGKGAAVSRLADYLGIGLARTVTVGDYDNDISMFRVAGTAVAVANASPAAKAAATHTTVDNHSHALAAVIADLERGRFFKMN